VLVEFRAVFSFAFGAAIFHRELDELDKRSDRIDYCVYLYIYRVYKCVYCRDVVFDLSCVNKFIINHHESSIYICCTHTTSCHLQLGGRMDNLTDLPKVAICSSDIDSETLEAIWIVSSLAAMAALTAIVGWVRSWRRRRQTETE